MGNLATPEFLIDRWQQLCQDPFLEDLPYKIELNAWGKIEMTPPAGNRHSHLQGVLVTELKRQLSGVVLPECALLTRIGIRAPDVCWASAEFFARFGEITPYTHAPEICIEVRSRSNVQAEMDEKTAAYLAAGASEVWIVSEDGTIRYFTASGEQPRSGFPVSITLPPPIG
ncbi:MAG TPA: Uma2 family endonuclease [Burkholderiales bacterium]|nr:Uma2 family endonuclease [Burkholderiales bacterium]